MRINRKLAAWLGGALVAAVGVQSAVAMIPDRGSRVPMGSPANTPPSLNLPGNITETATSPSGATVTYTVSADDAEDNPDPAPNCSPASGSTFPIGTTTVNCSVTDSGDLTTNGSFNVIVNPPANTAPSLNLPGTQTATATGPSGSTVTYSVTADDAEDEPNPTPNCSPASGSTFPIGTTTVNCSVTDSGDLTTNGSFTVSVQNTGAPTVQVPSNRTVEANGPSGSTVNYPAPTVTDETPNLQATCTPASGSLFRIGTTTVTCRATDAQGNVGTGSFTITVADRTPPVLTVPARLVLISTQPVPATDRRLQRFLSSATATDIVDASPTVTNNAPGSFPLGETEVVFTARDDAGNTTTATAIVLVSATPVDGGGEDAEPPDNPRNVKAFAGNFAVSIRWQKPRAKDVDRVEITRTTTSGRATTGSADEPTVVYSGRRNYFVATGLRRDVEYRFVIVAYDKNDNRSAGVAVVAFGAPSALRSPVNGAVLSGRVTITWQGVPKADRYNLQLWAAGRQKASFFPKRAGFTVPRQWHFDGETRRLRPGVWKIFVWPYFNERERYGKLHVSGQFLRPRAG